MSNEPVVIEAELTAHTDMAWMIDDGDDAVWIPRSQCQCDSENPEHGETYEFTLPEWLALEKGLI